MFISTAEISNETNQFDNSTLKALNSCLTIAEIFLSKTDTTNPKWLETIQGMLDETTSEIMFREEYGLIDKE